MDGPVEIVRIRHTSAAAIELGKTVPALIFGVHVAAAEIIRNLRPYDSFVHISHQEFYLSHELMARIEIPPRRHGQIFRPGAASGQPFRYTRPTV